jgi:hypothetical protein
MERQLTSRAIGLYSGGNLFESQPGLANFFTSSWFFSVPKNIFRQFLEIGQSYYSCTGQHNWPQATVLHFVISQVLYKSEKIGSRQAIAYLFGKTQLWMLLSFDI